MVAADEEGESAMPPRRGSDSVKVEEGAMERVDSVGGGWASVVAGVRCLPARWRRRFDGGREVRRDRSWRRVSIEVDDGSVSGTARDKC